MKSIYFFKAITPFSFFLGGLILAVFIPVNSNAQPHPLVKYENNPMIEGTWGNWNEELFGPVVIHDDGLYKMWYSGWKGGSRQIGYAWSTDGINWNLKEEPVIPEGTSSDWDFRGYPGTVLHMNGTYKMWYTGENNYFDFMIGYAESEDGIEWNVFADPVFEKGDPWSWDQAFVLFPQVYYDGIEYHMYYTGGPGPYFSFGGIGHATSTDGINWERDTKVIPLGDLGTFSDTGVRSSGLVFHNDTLHMFYDGWDGSGSSVWYGRIQVGYAWSTDYVTWVTDTTVYLGVGEQGEWDQHWVGLPTVLVQDDTMRMWYTGRNNDGPGCKIGYASYPPTISGIVNKSPLLFDVLSVSPNPFTDPISISYELPKKSMVELEVYNSKGQLISTLANEIRQQGAHEVSFEGAHLPAGVYFCALKTSEGVQMKKIIKQ